MWLALVWLVGGRGDVVRAEVNGAERSDAFPAGLSAYADPGAAAGVAGFSDDDHGYAFQAEPAAEAPAQQSYWPVLYSALVPGVGELTMGYEKRGIALIALDVLAWTGYFVKHDEGMDERDEYEAFADQYWTERKFIDDHPLVYPLQDQTLEYLEEQGQAVSGSGGDWWTGYIPYVSKEEDKQHYYENLGKYDWFVSGWSDYDPTIDPPVAESALREQYRAMRGESNDDLDDANSFIWVSLAARVFSIAETAIIVHNRRDAVGEASAAFDSPVALRARARGFDGGELALEIRFK
jgi:hypothetical protein